MKYLQFAVTTFLSIVFLWAGFELASFLANLTEILAFHFLIWSLYGIGVLLLIGETLGIYQHTIEQHKNSNV